MNVRLKKTKKVEELTLPKMKALRKSYSNENTMAQIQSQTESDGIEWRGQKWSHA